MLKPEMLKPSDCIKYVVLFSMNAVMQRRQKPLRTHNGDTKNKGKIGTFPLGK